jgi:hypothetical protein
MTKVSQVEEIILEFDGHMFYVEVAGRRIAKRASGESWIILEPGFTVTGCEPGSYDTITVEYDPVKARSH